MRIMYLDRCRVKPRMVASVLLAFAVAATLVVPGAGPALGQSDDGETNGGALKTQYDEVLGQESKLEAAFETQSRKMIEIAAQIIEVQAELDAVTLQLVAANRRLVEAEAAARRARTRFAAARRRLEKATSDLHAQAVSAYINGGAPSPKVEMLLRSFDALNDSGRASSYATALVDHQREVVLEFRSARTASSAASSEASRTSRGSKAIRDAIAETNSKIATNRVSLEGLKIEAANAAELQIVARDKLLSRKLDIEKRISEQEKSSDNIALVLIAAQIDEPDYEPGSIDFTPPIPGVSPGSPFGLRLHPILGYVRLHGGIDFGAATGTQIRAAADGLVIIAGVRGGYGNAVVIDHGQSVGTVYAHQSQLLVRVGQVVKAGDVIGRVGTTGLSTGAHLHFETRLRGVPVNPTGFIDF